MVEQEPHSGGTGASAGDGGVLSFDQLCEHIERELAMSLTTRSENARLVEDLGLDSIGVVEVLLLTNELAPGAISEDMADAPITLRELYERYTAGIQ